MQFDFQPLLSNFYQSSIAICVKKKRINFQNIFFACEIKRALETKCDYLTKVFPNKFKYLINFFLIILFD